jgi:hypothetical protein
MTATAHHPECGDDEVFLGNCDDKSFERIRWRTKRKGVVAYMADGTPWSERGAVGFPVFVQKAELPAERLESFERRNEGRRFLKGRDSAVSTEKEQEEAGNVIHPGPDSAYAAGGTPAYRQHDGAAVASALMLEHWADIVLALKENASALREDEPNLAECLYSLADQIWELMQEV